MERKIRCYEVGPWDSKEMFGSNPFVFHKGLDGSGEPEKAVAKFIEEFLLKTAQDGDVITIQSKDLPVPMTITVTSKTEDEVREIPSII